MISAAAKEIKIKNRKTGRQTHRPMIGYDMIIMIIIRIDDNDTNTDTSLQLVVLLHYYYYYY